MTEIEEPSCCTESIFKNLFFTMPLPVFFKDVNGIYQECNRAFADILGLPREKVIGASVYEVAPADLAAIYHNADRELILNRGQQVYETQLPYADGSRHDVIFYKSAVTDSHGTLLGLIGAIVDVTRLPRNYDAAIGDRAMLRLKTA